jgi:phthiocerol/phenolphthiocerol synthesis type-I polyketide synthase E
MVADIRVFTADGQVLVDCRGYAMRAVERDVLSGTTSTTSRSDREEGGRRAGVPLGLPPGSGIEPEAGVTLLLDLLDSRPVRQVAVRPFRDGKPVPVAGPVSMPVPVPPRRPVAAQAPTSPAPLPAAAPVSVPTPATPSATGDDDLERTRRLWSTVLGTTDIAPSDDFFDLGGNSLAAIDLATQVRKEFGIELNVAMLFEAPTLGEFTEALRTEGSSR